MYKCSTIKKQKAILTRNHAEVKVQFELILTLKLTARERLPRRHSATPSRQTENGTVNRHYTCIHRCKELSPLCSRPCQSTFSAGNTTGFTKKFTGAPFWILVAMQEMYPTKSICADMHIQAMKYRMKQTPKSHGVSLNI